MTIEATRVAANDRWTRCLRLRQFVEDGPLLRIRSRELDESAARPCHRNGIVEEDHARVLWTDDVRLQAGAREHRGLRRDWNVERREYREEIPGTRHETEARLPVRKTLIEARNRIGRIPRGVLDGAMLARGERVAEHRRRRRRRRLRPEHSRRGEQPCGDQDSDGGGGSGVRRQWPVQKGSTRRCRAEALRYVC